VELGYISDQFENGCKDCRTTLRLASVRNETIQGFGSILYIDFDCGVSNSIFTSRRHNSIFYVNTKASLGMVDAGIGPSQVQRLLSIMNLPVPNGKTLKKRETEVGNANEYQAELSCQHALEEEIVKTESR